ncbi:Stress response protein nst1, partial [Coemansia sp. RSA 2599]
MSAKTSTSPGIDARSDSVRRGGCAAGENSSCDRSSKGGKAQIEGNGKQAAVYGPELPPSMARSKVDDAAAGGIAGLSGTSNFIDIAKLLREESRNDDSKSVYMRRTESELQSLFYSHLTSIMDRHGYKDKHFREQDVARVMVDAGLMSSLSDDPALALASDLKTKMIGIVHKNLRQMASSVMVPEFFEDMAVDPMVIDTLVDMSRQGSSGSKQAASVVAFAAAAAIAEADADFEDALKALDTMTLVESFHLDELCRNQRNPASATWRSDSTDTEPRPPSEPHFTLSPASVPASVASSEPASAPALATETALLSSPASASKSASKSSLAETKKLMAQIRSAAKGTQINSASASSLKELAAKTEELRAKDTQVLENKDPVATVAAHIASIASVSNPAPNGSAAPPKAQSRKSRRKVKAKEREMAAAANGKAKAGLPAQSETQQSRVAASKPAPRPASSSQQRLADLNSALSPLESLCKTFLSSSTSDSGSINDYLEQLRKQSNRLDKLWSSDSADEHQQVRAFWIGLSDIERQALIFVEKEVVLARVRDHQNFSCNCNVCTRKREAIEHELDCLYECYYEELQEKVRQERMRVIIRKMEPMAKANILSSIGAVVDTAMSSLPANARPWSKEDLKNTITKSIKRAKLTSSLSHPDNREPADIGTFLMRAMTASVLDNLSAGDAVAKEKNESNRDAAIKGAVQTILDWAKGTLEPPRDSGDDLDPSDAESEILNNNDIFYTEHMLDTIDTFPTDSKKFFDMMERLAEFRMRREDAMLDEFNDDHDSVSANVVSSSAKSSHKDGESMTHSWVRRARDSARRQAHCPDCHGEISEPEDHAGGVSSMQRGAPSGSVDVFRDPTDLAAQSLLDSELCYATDSDFDDADGNDDVRGGRVGNPKGDEGAGCYSSGSEDQDCEETDEEDDDDDDEDDLCDTDDDDLDDLDDLDSEYAEREAEEGRKVFQLFAARLFEQRVINAYREKIARERQQNLIKELEEEEKEQQAKERRKQKKREREKERKKQFQLKKEQERLAKEAALKAEQERKREAEQKRYEEMMQKRREQELKAKKALEERNRRILEEADRRMEKERQQKQRAEQERLEKEREQMRKTREAESLQQQQHQQKQHKQTPKQKHKDRALAKGNELTQAKSTPMSPNVPATAATTAAAAPAPVPAVSAYPSSPKPAPRFSASEAAKSVPAATEPSPLNSIAPGSSPSISALGQMSVAAQHSLITSVS